MNESALLRFSWKLQDHPIIFFDSHDFGFLEDVAYQATRREMIGLHCNNVW